MIKIDLTFTRDFSVCISDFWHILLVEELKREVGVTINSQIMRFTGRAMEVYRELREMEQIKESIVARSIDDQVLSKKNVQDFQDNVKKAKSILKKIERVNIDE